MNLAFGIIIAMIYVFFDKIFGVMARQANFSPEIAVWLPNVLFGILAVYLLQNAKRFFNGTKWFTWLILLQSLFIFWESFLDNLILKNHVLLFF